MDSRLVYAVALVIGCWVLAANSLKLNDTHSSGALNNPINREGCGTKKVCLETPKDCNPMSNETCLFVSASSTNRPGKQSVVAYQLRGNSNAYIALFVSDDETQGGDDRSFICAQYNDTFRFFTATFNNGSLNVIRDESVSNVLGSVDGDVIRCTFTVWEKKLSQRMPGKVYIFAGSGNFSKGFLGNPEITLQSNGSVAIPNTKLPPEIGMPAGALNANITRTNCARTKLCEELPADCDPNGSGSCLFVSTRSMNGTGPGTDIAFELRGNSNGYIAVILSPDRNPRAGDMSFICAQFNDMVQFIPAKLNNVTFNVTNVMKAKDFLGSVDGDVIQCTFTALGLNATALRMTDTSFFLSLANGTFDGVTLGEPDIRLQGNSSLDLTNSTSNGATPAPPVTPGDNGGASLHSVSLVLLLLLNALIFRLV